MTGLDRALWATLGVTHLAAAMIVGYGIASGAFVEAFDRLHEKVAQTGSGPPAVPAGVLVKAVRASDD